jgi:IclR family acetate operon transcriptional repressor
MEALWRESDGKRLSHLSAELGLHKTTALRLLRTLVAIGAAHRDESSDRYFLGAAAFIAITHGRPSSSPTPGTVQETLDEVAGATGMFAVLATPDLELRRVVFTAVSKPGEGAVRNAAEKLVRPMHAAACGKIHLANLSQAELGRWMRGELPRVTDSTITSRARLAAELKQVKRQGYALGMGECCPGYSGLAVPVLGAEGRVVASLGVAVRSTQAADLDLARTLDVLRRASERISELLRSTRLDAGAG